MIKLDTKMTDLITQVMNLKGAMRGYPTEIKLYESYKKLKYGKTDLLQIGFQHTDKRLELPSFVFDDMKDIVITDMIEATEIEDLALSKTYQLENETLVRVVKLSGDRILPIYENGITEDGFALIIEAH